MKFGLVVSRLDLYLLGVAFFLFISLNPYYVWGGYQLLYVSVFLVLVILSFRFYFIFSKTKSIWAILISFLVFIYSARLGASYGGAIAFSCGTFLILAIKNTYLNSIAYKFRLLFVIVMAPGAILWVVHYFLGVDFLYLGAIDSQIIPNQIKVDEGVGYASYPFAIVLDYMLEDQAYRLMGPFDEPGVVGTICAFLLAANRFKINSKVDILILFYGILSFSLAFYFLVLFFLLVVSMRRPHYLLIIFLMSAFVFPAAHYNETIYKYTLDRVKISGGEISGDNRENESLSEAFLRWKDSDIEGFLFGIPGYENSGESTWKSIAITSGLLGVMNGVLILMLAIFTTRRDFDIYVIAFLLVFTASIYQRPDVINPFYIFIFCCGVFGLSKAGEGSSSIRYNK